MFRAPHCIICFRKDLRLSTFPSFLLNVFSFSTIIFLLFRFLLPNASDKAEEKDAAQKEFFELRRFSFEAIGKSRCLCRSAVQSCSLHLSSKTSEKVGEAETARRSFFVAWGFSFKVEKEVVGQLEAEEKERSHAGKVRC